MTSRNSDNSNASMDKRVAASTVNFMPGSPGSNPDSREKFPSQKEIKE